MVMPTLGAEAMDGGDLFDAIVDPIFDLNMKCIASVVRDCCSALAFLHRHGVVRAVLHRTHNYSHCWRAAPQSISGLAERRTLLHDRAGNDHCALVLQPWQSHLCCNLGNGCGRGMAVKSAAVSALWLRLRLRRVGAGVASTL